MSTNLGLKLYIDVKSVLFVYFHYKVCVQIVTWICWRGCRNNYGRLGPTLAASFEDLARCDNVACLFYIYYFGGCSSELVELFHKYYFGGSSSELAELFPFYYSRGLLAILIVV